jgi:hypothetical protein
MLIAALGLGSTCGGATAKHSFVISHFLLA